MRGDRRWCGGRLPQQTELGLAGLQAGLLEEIPEKGFGRRIGFEPQQVVDVLFRQGRGDGVAAPGVEIRIDLVAEVGRIEAKFDEGLRRRRGELMIHVETTVLLAAGVDGLGDLFGREEFAERRVFAGHS